MVQPNKVDFDVRKLLKRKKVSRDRMALPEHSECCIRRFYALVCSEDNALIENSKDCLQLMAQEAICASLPVLLVA
jgi:hypothetical protein